MALKFLTGTQTAYDALGTKDSNCLYFTSDTHRIYKGSDLYTKDVIFVETLPTTDIVANRMYITADGTAKVYNGTKWVDVAAPAETTIDGSSTENDAKIANIGAIKAYIASLKYATEDDLAEANDKITAIQEALGIGDDEIVPVDDKINAALEGAAHDITYDASTLTITVPMYNADGSEAEALVINLPKDNFVKSGSYNAETQAIDLVVGTEDGTTTTVSIPAASLVDVYVSDNTGLKGVTVTVTSDNKISAALEVDAASILSVNAEGKLTIDTSAIYDAIDAKFDKANVIKSTDATEATEDKVLSAAASKKVTDALDERVGTVEEKVSDLETSMEDHTHVVADITDFDSVKATAIAESYDAETGKLATEKAVRDAIDAGLTWQTF